MNKLTTKNKLRAAIVIAFILVMAAYFVLVMAVMSADAAPSQDCQILEASCYHDPIVEPEKLP